MFEFLEFQGFQRVMAFFIVTSRIWAINKCKLFTQFLCRVCSVLSSVRAILRSRYETVPTKGPERVFKRMRCLAAASLREAPFSLYRGIEDIVIGREGRESVLMTDCLFNTEYPPFPPPPWQPPRSHSKLPPASASALSHSLYVWRWEKDGSAACPVRQLTERCTHITFQEREGGRVRETGRERKIERHRETETERWRKKGRVIYRERERKRNIWIKRGRREGR